MTYSTNSSFPPPFTVPGYTVLDSIYLGLRTVIYRALCNRTQGSVVIKQLTVEYPTFGELVQFRNQYAIAKKTAHLRDCQALEP